jgi:Ca2+-binding RTX toxin-like protein
MITKNLYFPHTLFGAIIHETGLSRDLLIGGPKPESLFSGAGDDFLFGGGGNGTLNG